MKLYELPRYTHFILTEQEYAIVYLFDHIDGSYSVCYDEDLNIIHFSANSEVEIINVNLGE